MDYLDPRKRLRHTIILYVGYCLIGIAIVIATTVLLYQAYGFGVDRKGTIIQNGLVFVSSQPGPASIYIDNKLKNAKTNTRLTLPEDIYKLSLERTGYQTWQRSITVEGGQVSHYDYPLLVPKNIVSAKLLTYPQLPGLVSQSPDKRWLVVAIPGKFGSFDLFDLKNPSKSPTTLSLTDSTLTASEGDQTWTPIEWADDNQHLLLQHGYDDKSEYILLDRQTPLQSINLSTILKVNPSQLKLVDKKYDHYHAYDSVSQTLSAATLKAPALELVQSGVISYQSYGTDVILYTTKVGASAGRVRVQLKVGDRTYTIRSVAANSTYVLDVTKYHNVFYVVVGASSENKVYIYRDPAAQIGNNLFQSPTPIQVLRVNGPNYVAFSSNAQYVVAENGAQFGVYDIETKHSFNFIAQPLDAPQQHANWMDGNRLTYVSGGKQLIFDYDYLNQRTLGAAVPAIKPMFAPDFKYSYTFSSGSDSQINLNQTALRIPTEL